MSSLPNLAPSPTELTKRLKFVIFGGTGPCGILLIRKALEVYPKSTVVVYARSPQKVPEDLTQHERVRVVTGTLEELDKVEQVLNGALGHSVEEAVLEPTDPSNVQDANTQSSKIDVVLSALGPPVTKGLTYPANHPIATFYDHLIDIMFKHHVKRLIVMCTASHPDPRDKKYGNPLTFGIVTTVKIFAHNAYLEFKEIGNVIRRKGGEAGDEESHDAAEDVQKPKLDWTLVRVPVLTSQDKEYVVAGYVGDGITGNALTKKAFAAFCIREVEERQWVKKAPFICTPLL